MKTYLGIVQQSGSDQEFYPQYVLQENGGFRAGKRSKILLPKDKILNGIVQAKVDEKNGQEVVVFSEFPAPGDPWFCVVSQGKALEALLAEGMTTPISKTKYYPPDGAAVLIRGENDKKLFGPVIIKRGKSADHKVLIIDPLPDAAPLPCNELLTFVSPTSSTNKKYHLRLAPKRTSATRADRPKEKTGEAEEEPQAPHTDAENSKAIIGVILNEAVSEANSIFLKQPVSGGLGADDTPHPPALRLMLEAADLRKTMLEAQKRVLHDENIRSGQEELWMPMLRDVIIPAFETKLQPVVDFCSTVAAGCAAVAADFKKHSRTMRELRCAAEILLSADVSELYEYYCLLRIAKKLRELGFEKSKAGERFPYKGVKGSENLANTLYFKKGDMEITLYREPVVFDDSVKNNLRLYRRDSQADCSRPDFVLKLTMNKSKDIYAILDAKFADPKNIAKSYLPLVVHKYFLRLGTQRKSDSIAMVWTLQGRLDGATPYVCPTPSPMEQAAGPFPSFGNCTVNEQNKNGMDAFWEIFKKLLPSA